MALTNYTELKATLANWLNRSDLTTEIADDFIKLAEADFNSKLRVRAMISQANVTVNAETAALPTDFLQIRDFYILNGQTKVPLTYTTPAQMDTTSGTSTTGLPTTYTILGDTFRFSPKPDATYTAVINFYKRFSALSSTVATNFILTNHPAIYLYGSLFHAANFLGGINPQQIQTWQLMYSTAMERLELNDREDEYNGSPLQVRTVTSVASPFISTS
jgi:hypothetical protein|tara:strand:- start:572 stop:1225 length:654 start_codon:yes stop_codon:yes gene_type:complete